MTQKPKILIVDDKPQNLFALEKILKKLEVDVLKATSGFDALSLTLEHEFCMGIVDIQMPEMDGYELVELLRSNEGTAALPVIFVSAIYSDEYHHRKGYDAGAVDFLSKPFNPDILLSKVRVFLDLYHQRMKLQELIEQLNDANQQLVKLNADKDKFFSIIAHDLKGPFQPLLGFAELLPKMATTASSNDIQEMSRKIYISAKSVYNLLENLLQWSRMQRGRLEYCPLRLELKQISEQNTRLLSANAADKGIMLRSTVPSEVFAFADEHMLDTVIRNLVSNALKFTPTGGQVTVKAEAKSLEQDTYFAEISVVDTGVGMNQAGIDKLFKIEVHFTNPGTNKEQGTGLGLIICKEMVEKNGGKIWVESELGKGTAVKFTVPLDGRFSFEILQQHQELATEVEDVTTQETVTKITEPALIPPPPNEMEALFELAMAGDIMAIQDKVIYLKQLDEKYIPFATKLDDLAKDFEEQEILDLIKAYMPGEK